MLIALIIAVLSVILGFLLGSRVVLVRYVPVEASAPVKSSDLYPKRNQDGPDTN